MLIVAYEFDICRCRVSEYLSFHASIVYSISWAPLRVSFDREGRATIRLFFGDRWVTLNGMEWNGIIFGMYVLLLLLLDR